MFGEKAFHRLIEIELVLFVGKAVTLILLDSHNGHQVHRETILSTVTVVAVVAVVRGSSLEFDVGC
jgi:hypothetical protein